MILDTYGENDAYAVTCENCAMVLETAGFPKKQESSGKRRRMQEKGVLQWKVNHMKERPESRKRPKKGIELARAYYEQLGNV